MNLCRCLLAVLVVFSGWAGSASATLTAPVTVDGQDWLQPMDFINLSWNTIASVCDPATGVCNGTLNGNDLTGWNWAGIDEVHALFNYYLGSSILGPDNTNTTIDSSFVDAFYADGWLPTVGTYPSAGTIGFTSDAASGSVLGTFAGFFAGTNTIQTGNMPNIPGISGTTGGWFHSDLNAPPTDPIILPDVTTVPDPVAPPPPDSTPLQTFVFNNPQAGNWFDPVSADAYLYELLGGGDFLEVRGVPGYSDLQIAWGEGYASILEFDLDPGESYFFGTGVTSFMLSGFTPAFDAEDPNAIPTYLDFTGSPTELRMTALALNASSAVPVPATLPLLGIGLAAIGYSRRKRKPHS